MIKLLKVCVVAFLAGSVFAPVASRAGEIDGKLIACENLIIMKESTQNHVLARDYWLGHTVHEFSNGRVKSWYMDAHIDPDALTVKTAGEPHPQYRAFSKVITWYRHRHYELDRKTLQLKIKAKDVKINDETTVRMPEEYETCEILDGNGTVEEKLLAYFNELVEEYHLNEIKERKGNKL